MAMLRPAFREVLSELFAVQAEFLVVGAFAMSAHQFPRATGDLDIFVRPDPINARRVWEALARFGAPLDDYDITVEDLSRAGLVFWLGKEPNRIDVMTAIDGVSFQEAWETRVCREVGGVELPVLSLENLLKNKKSTGRPKDGFDAAWIEEETGSE
ncbi:MAG TPA: nucleotidyltransferase [Longimicrobium sp.]|nr:nucleotidyltransferase [Longimicrobium sp.]